MYNPHAFRVEDRKSLLDFIRSNSFGILVSRKINGLMATHIPLLVEEMSDGGLKLIGHMAKANGQWQSDESEVLVIFSGPHTYISPSWYDEPNSVPTWNYVAVHAEGKLKLLDDARLSEVLEKMVG